MINTDINIVTNDKYGHKRLGHDVYLFSDSRNGKDDVSVLVGGVAALPGLASHDQ
jgi:hypothetical protein